MVKKICIVALLTVMTIVAGCGAKSYGMAGENVEAKESMESAADENTEESAIGIMTGGYNVSDDITITEDVRAIFDKALDGMTGVSYEPVAYLGYQVVAGTNHAILCKATITYPDAVPHYTIMYIYEDLDGNVEITGNQDIELGM